MKVRIQGRRRRVSIVVDHGRTVIKKRFFGGSTRKFIPPKPIPRIPANLEPHIGRPGRFVPHTATTDCRWTKMAKASGLDNYRRRRTT